MPDLDSTIAGDRNWLERIARHVPGFSGYRDRESRREADLIVRSYGVKLLERIVSDLHDATKGAPLEDMDVFGELVNQVEKLRNELRYSDRGYSGFFDDVKWDRPERLDAVYERDAALVEAVAALAERTAENDYSPTDLRDQIRALERQHADRRDAILGLLENH